MSIDDTRNPQLFHDDWRTRLEYLRDTGQCIVRCKSANHALTQRRYARAFIKSLREYPLAFPALSQWLEETEIRAELGQLPDKTHIFTWICKRTQAQLTVDALREAERAFWRHREK